MMMTSRRIFLKKVSITLSIPFFASLHVRSQEKKYPKILFRMGWDAHNNDEIALIPALYRICQKTILNTEFYLWLKEPDPDILEMLNNNFTSLKFITGEIDDSGNPTTDELKTILSETDLFFYSSSVSSRLDWAGNRKGGYETNSLMYCLDHKIPYIIYGLEDIPKDQNTLERFMKIVNGAEYAYVTSSSFNRNLKESDVKIPGLRILPNLLFAFDLRNESQSRSLLEEYDLEGTDFLTMDFKRLELDEDKLKEYGDKIRTIISTWIEKTKKPVILIPNNQTDIDLTAELIHKPLGPSIKSKVILLKKRLNPDIAGYIYEKSRIVSGMSLFPACSAVHSGIPVFFLTNMNLSVHATTIEDMGLKNSIYQLDANSGEVLAEKLLELNSEYVNNILESDKARENATKKITDEFSNIDKFMSKSIGKDNTTQKKNKKQVID